MNIDEDYIIQSIARSGKSYSVIGQLPDPNDWPDDFTAVYVSGKHAEAEAAYDKATEFGHNPVYITGEQRAREEHGISTSGAVQNTIIGNHPRDLQDFDDSINAHQSLIQKARNWHFVITVPELVDQINDIDLLITTEEAAFSRFQCEALKVADVERVNGWNRTVNSEFRGKKAEAERIMEEIDDRNQTDYVHNQLYTASQVIVDICEMFDDWCDGNFTRLAKSWEDFVDDVERRINDIGFEEPPVVSEVKNRLEHFNVDDKRFFLNVIFHDGLFTYGDDDDNRKQLFLVGDTDKIFIDLSDDMNLWTAGNSIPHMQRFHEQVYGDYPENQNEGLITLYPEYGPIQEAHQDMVILRYEGGENPNQQSAHVQKTIEQVQTSTPSPGLIISGSSRHCASHAEKISRTFCPSEQDDLEDLEQMATKANMNIAAPENSRYTEGVDTPWLEFAALYNGDFATPIEDYIAEEKGKERLKKWEKIRAAQNSVLRPCNIPDGNGGVEGTGKTPSIVPSMHVPDALFEMLEEWFDITVMDVEDPIELRRWMLMFLDPDDEFTVDNNGQIVAKTETTDTQAFSQLASDSSAPQDSTADSDGTPR